MSTARVLLKPRKAQPFYYRHPWVFSGAIAAVEGDPGDGDEVDVYSHGGTFIARGLYNSHSKIRVRLYCWQPDVALDERFWQSRLQSALRLRREVLGLGGPGEACRLVFSEADQLSGLIVDKYDRWLALQCTSLGIARRLELIGKILMDLTSAEGIYLRTERGMGDWEGMELRDEPLCGIVPSEAIPIRENGLSFLVDIAQGQKTGFFLDQRDNRKRVAEFCRGRRVLDAFCYSGGFALHAARAGASEVVGVDVSESAVSLAQANARNNGLSNVSFLQGDVFEVLASMADAGEQFDVVVLDPPKFARQRRAVPSALEGYRRLAKLGLQMLPSAGVFVLCCCSGLITAEMLTALLNQVAAAADRDIRILESRGAAADHPISVSCPETEYLKCLICHVG